MWTLIFLGFFLFTIFSIGYLYIHIGKFEIVKKLSRDSKWKKRLIPGIPILAIIAYIFADLFVAVVSLTHLVIIWIVIELIFKLIRKYRTIKTKVYIEGILAISVTTVYLVAAWLTAVTVVPTEFTVKTDKLREEEQFRIVMFADAHIGCTFDGEKLAEYIHEMGRLNPDILVIVGDYVDDDTTKEDMLAATKALGEIDTKYGVYYVFGNHDKGYYNRRGFDENDLRTALLDEGVTILEDEIVEINDFITLVGRQDMSEINRASMSDIMKSVDKEKYCIVLDHQQNDQLAEREAGADMVLSGHTHGGQLLPINYMGELAGLNEQTKGLRVIGQTAYLVTSGISDWAIPFKSGCRSEYQVIDIVR